MCHNCNKSALQSTARNSETLHIKTRSSGKQLFQLFLTQSDSKSQLHQGHCFQDGCFFLSESFFAFSRWALWKFFRCGKFYSNKYGWRKCEACLQKEKLSEVQHSTAFNKFSRWTFSLPHAPKSTENRCTVNKMCLSMKRCSRCAGVWWECLLNK